RVRLAERNGADGLVPDFHQLAAGSPAAAERLSAWGPGVRSWIVTGGRMTGGAVDRSAGGVRSSTAFADISWASSASFSSWLTFFPASAIESALSSKTR